MYETIHIGWKKPPEGWIKFTRNGSSKGNGVFRLWWPIIQLCREMVKRLHSKD